MDDAPIVLLDDVLSAVDAHVGAKIFDECVQGLLKGKTILLVTHAIQYLSACDSVLVMAEGKIVEGPASYDTLMETDGPMRKLVSVYEEESMEETKKKDEKDGDDEEGDDDKKKKTEDGGGEAKTEEGDGKDLTGDEERSDGNVDLKVYMDYFRASGWGAIMVVVAMFAMQPFSKIMSTWWLTAWSGDKYPGTSQAVYLVVYCVLAASTVVFAVVK